MSIWNRFFITTVDGALASFNKAKEDLKRVADKHAKEIDDYVTQQNEIAEKQLHSQTERNRAISVIGKIESLISV